MATRMGSREARFAVIDSIRERLPEIPEDEVFQDVAEALAAIRAKATTH